jgi:hypothetical protein
MRYTGNVFLKLQVEKYTYKKAFNERAALTSRNEFGKYKSIITFAAY